MNIPGGLDTGPNHPLDFVSLLFDFLDAGDNAVFRVGEKLIGPREEIESKLFSLVIERRRYQSCREESLFKCEKSSFMRVQEHKLHVSVRIQTKVSQGQSRNDVRRAAGWRADSDGFPFQVLSRFEFGP